MRYELEHINEFVRLVKADVFDIELSYEPKPFDYIENYFVRNIFPKFTEAYDNG